MSDSNLILFAYHSKDWKYGDDKNDLKGSSNEITASEYEADMKGRIFCPLCATPIFRSPSDDALSANNITAHFKHFPKTKYVESAACDWRSKSKSGLKYTNEEQVNQAIEDKQLTVVSSWAMSPPDSGNDIDEKGEYSKTAIESEDGQETEMPIGRHTEGSFMVPSVIHTVMALCRNFPENLIKGFYFPGSQYPQLLSDKLFNVKSIKADIPSSEALYFGKISGFRGLNKRNVIEIECSNSVLLKIYTHKGYDLRKNIDSKCIGRFILFSATLYWENQDYILATKINDWGCYSLLPQKYEKFLPTKRFSN
jgi:hypothetical protein